MEIKDIGDEAELKFKEWLDKEKIPYWYIQQDIGTFSISLKSYLSKRPDFMILIPSLGLIFVDVKFKRVDPKYKIIPLDAKDTMSYSNLQRHFNLPVWYAVSNSDHDYNTWYWIPTSKVLEIGKTHTSNKTNSNFFAVDVREFIQISYDDSLDRLFSKIFLKNKVES